MTHSINSGKRTLFIRRIDDGFVTIFLPQPSTMVMELEGIDPDIVRKHGLQLCDFLLKEASAEFLSGFIDNLIQGAIDKLSADMEVKP
jgi:hypothetical protein